MQVLSEIFTTVNLIDRLHFGNWIDFQLRLVIRGLGLCWSFKIQEWNIFFRTFLRPLLTVDVLAERSRRLVIDIAILLIGHGGVEALTMGSFFHGGEEFFLHFVFLFNITV